MVKSSSYGVQWNADKIHTLRWPHGAVRGFEEAIRDLLSLPKTDIVSAKAVLGGPNMNNGTILSMAVAYALRHESEDQKTVMDIEAADALIDAAAQKGESVEDLKLKLYESFLVTNDPSSVASWKESLKNSKDRQEKVIKMAQELERLQAEQKIKEAEETLKKLTSGQKPPDLAASS